MAIERIDIGNHVECDMCCKDFTESEEGGGFIFGSKAVGPCCAAKIERDAREYGEEKYIKGRCIPDMSFAAWVLALRDGNNTIEFRTGEDARC